MFSKKDFEQIDRDYFYVKSETGYNIILQSQNTNHIWTIHCADLSERVRIIEVYHQHKESDISHIQPNFHPHSVKEAQIMIKKHDAYQLNGRKKIK